MTRTAQPCLSTAGVCILMMPEWYLQHQEVLSCAELIGSWGSTARAHDHHDQARTVRQTAASVVAAGRACQQFTIIPLCS